MERVDADHVALGLPGPGEEGRGALRQGHEVIVIGHSGVPEDLDQSQVGVYLLCPARSSPNTRPRYRDPTVLHPRDEDTTGVGDILATARAVQQSSQCREIRLDLTDDTG